MIISILNNSIFKFCFAIVLFGKCVMTAYNRAVDGDEIEDGQRSKLEEKMKTESKKLTRLREAVKKMIDKGIKDESGLIRSREKTESRMELWKNYEQDRKMKTFSRAGLARGYIFNSNYLLIENLKNMFFERVSVYCSWHSKECMIPPTVKKYVEQMKFRTCKRQSTSYSFRQEIIIIKG